MMNTLPLLFTLALRNLGRNKRRTLLTFLAIAFGLWSAISLAALARGISDGMMKEAIWKLTGHAQVHAAKYLDDPSVEHTMPAPAPQLIEALKDVRIKQWSTRVRVPAVVVSERESYGVTLVGIDPLRERGLSFIGDAVSEGRMLSSAEDSGVVLGKKLVSLLQTEIGKRVVLMTQGPDNKVAERGFRVIGVFDTDLESTEKAFAFISRKAAQDMLGLGDGISEISLMLYDKEELPPILDALKMSSPTLDTKGWTELEPLVVSIQKIQGGFLQLWFCIVVIAVSFGLVNTIFMSVFERTREIGLIQALGMKPNSILILIVIESALLLLFGGIAGNVMSQVTVFLLKGGLDISAFSRGAEIAGIASVVYPALKSFDLLFANVLIVVIGVVASLYPAWRASRLIPLHAITRA